MKKDYRFAILRDSYLIVTLWGDTNSFWVATSSDSEVFAIGKWLREMTGSFQKLWLATWLNMPPLKGSGSTIGSPVANKKLQSAANGKHWRCFPSRVGLQVAIGSNRCRIDSPESESFQQLLVASVFFHRPPFEITLSCKKRITIVFGSFFLKKNLLKSLLESSIQLEERGWELLNKRWMIFFIFLAFLNEIVWRTQTEDFWVKFKVFGIIPITFIFMIFQINLIKKYKVNV